LSGTKPFLFPEQRIFFRRSAFLCLEIHKVCLRRKKPNQQKNLSLPEKKKVIEPDSAAPGDISVK